jgi:hypothetical protein
VRVWALKFGVAQKNVSVWVCARKNVGVQDHAINLALCGVHTMHVVCRVLLECRGVLLVHVQCGYMLSHDSFVSGVHKFLVRSGDVLKSGMVQCVEYNACGISTRDTKIVCNM